ncbi:MAG: hypothetical protein SFU99_06195 [Saprospiraceae bacterium]|nr:hypothetical protein [Saprospiraceae bacterium]
MILLSIGDWWNALNNAEQIFWGIAILSSVLFVFQFIVSFFLGTDFDGDMDVGISAGVDDGGHYSLDSDFSLFSLRSIIAFFTFFGWAGVVALGAGAGIMLAVAFAIFSGGAALVLVAYMFYWFAKMTKEGNVKLQEALQKQAEVYLTIPAKRNGQGKVHLTLGNSLREMDAITDDETLINTGSKVQITDILSDNVLLVKAIPEKSLAK